MAAQALVEQNIVFVSANNQYDQNAILANSLIQSFAANSQGNNVMYSYESFENWNAGTSTWTYSSIFRLRFYVSSAFQATIQADIPSIQSTFPQYTVITYGTSASFGN